jgi:CheY-like chemotaxis protein
MPKQILALVDDLFFSTKISSTAASCGVAVQFVENKDALLEKAKREPPGLIIVDLNGSTTQPLEAIQAVKSNPQLRSIPLLAYLSHVQTDLREKAVVAGCDNVLPRSAFSHNLTQILKHHS